jgi:hypothetical protein
VGTGTSMCRVGLRFSTLACALSMTRPFHDRFKSLVFCSAWLACRALLPDMCCRATLYRTDMGAVFDFACCGGVMIGFVAAWGQRQMRVTAAALARSGFVLTRA